MGKKSKSHGSVGDWGSQRAATAIIIITETNEWVEGIGTSMIEQRPRGRKQDSEDSRV